MISNKIQNILTDSINKNGKATLLVCGGSSPLKIFEELSIANLEWDKITISLIDDRVVEESNPDSNIFLLKKHLLKDKAANANFISLNDNYADLLKANDFFDVAIIGIGPDGHFASLFPSMINSTDFLNYDSDPQVISTGLIGSPRYKRTSMNLALILKTLNIFIVAPNKEKMIVIDEGYKDKMLPVYYLLNQPLRRIEILKTF